jgi:hypothetical protein
VIDGTDLLDATSCYPLFLCERWDRLADDLEKLKGRLVSAVIVSDPFAPLDDDILRRTFDHVRLFKNHHVIDTDQPQTLSRHHRQEVSKARRRLSLERCADPAAHLDEWLALFELLKQRHGIQGMRAFSRASFERQMQVPGLVLYRARRGDQTVGLHLWYVNGLAAYGHLGVTTNEDAAAYGLYAVAIDDLRPQVRWIDLGAGAGVRAGSDSGLELFKRGFSTATRPVYLCGRILDRPRYEQLARQCDVRANDYFPAYRAGEFE